MVESSVDVVTDNSYPFLPTAVYNISTGMLYRPRASNPFETRDTERPGKLTE
jgi:hypothetical protein